MSKVIKATDEFVYKNNVQICGRIYSKQQIKNGTAFVVSVNHKYDKKREHIQVIFEGALGKYYNKSFDKGDFVVLNGVVQGKYDKRVNKNIVSVYGTRMTNQKSLGKKLPDFRKLTMRGKIDRTIVINDDIILVYLYTNVTKETPNPNKKSETDTFTKDFISVAPIALYRNIEGGHDAKALEKTFTKGTWLEIEGRINTKKSKLDDGKIYTQQHLVAHEVFIIGEIQIPNQ